MKKLLIIALFPFLAFADDNKAASYTTEEMATITALNPYKLHTPAPHSKEWMAGFCEAVNIAVYYELKKSKFPEGEWIDVQVDGQKPIRCKKR